MRLGKKFYSIAEIQGYKKHMNREIDVQNADPTKIHLNYNLVGTDDIVTDVKDFISDIPKFRANCIYARELLLTASPKFFENSTELEKQRWIRQNLKFLKKEYTVKDKYNKDMFLITHAVIHQDETTLHIHALMIPKQWDIKKERYKLNHRDFFGGEREVLSELQDRYANSMQELGLERGLKGSKARHIKIRDFYRMLNMEINNIDKVFLQTQNSLLKTQLENLQRILKDFDKVLKENKETKELSIELYKELQKISKERDNYRQAIMIMSKNNLVKAKDIVAIFNTLTEEGKKEVILERKRQIENM